MDLLTEFRRELMKAINNINPDDFLTKNEVEGLIRNSYGKAKDRCENDEDVLLRMSNDHYDEIKAESQRINVSMTAMLNFIIDDYVQRQKLEHGTEEAGE